MVEKMKIVLAFTLFAFISCTRPCYILLNTRDVPIQGHLDRGWIPKDSLESIVFQDTDQIIRVMDKHYVYTTKGLVPIVEPAMYTGLFRIGDDDFFIYQRFFGSGEPYNFIDVYKKKSGFWILQTCCLSDRDDMIGNVEVDEKERNVILLPKHGNTVILPFAVLEI